MTEFVKIHLQSYKKYLVKNNFDIFFEDLNKKFVKSKGGKIKQLKDISIFLKKHMY